MSNPFFNWIGYVARFVPRTKARAEDVNAALDLVDNGFADVDTELQLKAPLESPVLTGDPTAPTPALSNDSETLATTAYVHNAVAAAAAPAMPLMAGKTGRFLTNDGTDPSWGWPTVRRFDLSSNSTVGETHGAAVLSVTASCTLTLAAPATLGAGWWAEVRNDGAAGTTVTLAHTSGNIDGLTTYAMYDGEVRRLYCDGSTIRSLVLGPFRRLAASSTTIAWPPGYRDVGYDLMGSGGGGSSGGKASGGGSPAGGCGGGGGGRYLGRLTAPAAGTVVSLNVGAGGVGGAARSTNGTPNAGTDGSASSIAWSAMTRAQVRGGQGGVNGVGGDGGSPAAAHVGGSDSAPALSLQGGVGGVDSVAAGVGTGAEYGGAGGGAQQSAGGDAGSSLLGGPAGGGGAKTFGALTAYPGGDGGVRGSMSPGGGGGGGPIGTAGSQADDAGGGGGGSSITPGVDGGDGADGSGYAAGGGGGGGSGSTGNSGAGGDGSDGCVEVWGEP